MRKCGVTCAMMLLALTVLSACQPKPDLASDQIQVERSGTHTKTTIKLPAKTGGSR